MRRTLVVAMLASLVETARNRSSGKIVSTVSGGQREDPPLSTSIAVFPLALTMADGTDGLFRPGGRQMNGDHISTEAIGAAELKLDPGRAQIASHAAQRIAQGVGRLGPARRAPQVFVGDLVQP